MMASPHVLAAAAAGVGDQPTAARSWIWAVVAGLLLSGALLVHAGWRAFCALPEPVRDAAVATIRRHPRLLAVQLAVALWTLVYALYNLAYPNSFLSPRLAQAATVSVVAPAPPPVVVVPPPQPPVAFAPAPAPALAAPPVAPSAADFFDTPPAAPVAPQPTAGVVTPSPSPQPCQVRPATDVLRMLDGPATTVTGKPLGSDAAAVAESAAGCSAPAAAWAGSAVGRTALTAAPPARCGDVLGQLVLLRYIAPMAGVRVTYVDRAISDVTAACGRTERTSP